VLATDSDDTQHLLVIIGQGNCQWLPLQGAVVVAVGATLGRVGQQVACIQPCGKLFEERGD
jgi:hypothetical protein